MSLKISIIIATFNAEATLSNTLESIAKQTYRSYEVLIIDGVSTDATLAISSSFLNRINGRIISEKDKGIYDALNKGIKLAKGEWLYFIGSDDVLYDNEVLEKMSKYLENDIDIVYGNTIWLPERIAEKGIWDYKKLLKQSINHQRVFYKRLLFDQYGDFNTDYSIAADHDLNIRLFCSSGVRSKYIDDNIAFYHSGGFSSNKIDINFWEDWKKILPVHFKSYIPIKDIYLRMSWYCWYQLGQKNYFKFFTLFFDIYFHSFSLRFVKHTASQVLKTFRLNG